MTNFLSDTPGISFLFKCEDCHMILTAKFEEAEDLKKIYNDEFVLECLCGSKCFVLRD